MQMEKIDPRNLIYFITNQKSNLIKSLQQTESRDQRD